MNLVDALYWINGAFKGALNWTPTANRTITLPDATGTILLDTTTVPLAEPRSTTLRLGTGSGVASTSGGSWASIGSGAGNRVTTGYEFVAVGADAGTHAITGSRWTAIGYFTGGYNSNGQNWTAIGAYALNNSISGSNNTAIGYSAGGGIQTGQGNTIVGANIGGLPAALTNNVILGSGDGVIKFQIDASGIATLTATPAIGDSSFKVATTAFVQNATAIAGAVVNPVGVTIVDWAIPAGVRRLTLLSRGVAIPLDSIVRLGSSAGLLTTGYNNIMCFVGLTTGLNSGSTIGLQVPDCKDNTGSFCMDFYRSSPHHWNSRGQAMNDLQYIRLSSGNIGLPGELTTLRFMCPTAINSGSLQLLWEF